MVLVCLNAVAATDSVWLTRSWRTDDGLPNNNVTTIAQGADGYLWVGTRMGLVRFDGVQFTKFPYPNIEAPNIQALCVTSSGRLWVLPETGQVIGLNSDFSPLTLPTRDLPSQPPALATESNDGSLWLAYNNAIYRVKDGRAMQVAKGDPTVARGRLYDFVTDGDGDVWLARGNTLGFFHDGQFQRLPHPSGIVHVAAGPSNIVWAVIGSRLFQCDTKSHLVDFGEFQTDNPRAEAWAMMQDHTGAVWIGTDGSGLFRHDDAGFRKVETSHPYILSLAEDREGNIWAGTAGGGLDRISPKKVQLETVNDGHSQDAIQSVCQDTNGVLWGATQSGSLVSRTDGRWTLAMTNWHFTEVITCVAADHDGSLWIGTRDEKLYRWKGGRLTEWGRAKGIVSHTIVALLPDSHGDLWIGEFGNPNLVQRLHEDTLETIPSSGNGGRITALAEDANGDIWIGTQHGLLMRALPNSVKNENTIIPDLPHSIVLSLYATPDGALWIGYAGAGLGRLKNGRFSRITTGTGSFDDTISEIISDHEGWFWFGGERGICKVRQADLDEFLDGNRAQLSTINYGPNEGLISLEADSSDIAPYVSPTPIQDAEGRLWMPMRTSLAVVDPRTGRKIPSPPPVLLTQMIVDGKTVAAYGSPTFAAGAVDLKARTASVRLPPDYHRMTITFTALHFSAPENVHVRYQLQGYDSDWIDAGTLREAGYSRLDAGNYRFRVQARYGDGAWNETAMAIAIAPFFWQTLWFRLLAITSSAIVVIATVRYISFRRLRAKVRKLEQRAALDREKARIARDLHDNLGSRLTKIISLSKMTFRARAVPEQAGLHAQQIGLTAKQVINSLDETVWVLNSRNDNLPNLIDYLGQTAVEFLRSADVRCRVDFPEHPPALMVPADVRHNLFLAVQEALNNVVRHAGASEVRLSAAQDAQSLTFVIEDNGRGFDQAPLNGSADGLRNMRRRMEEMNGRFQVESAPGAGTRITLILPFTEIG